MSTPVVDFTWSNVHFWQIMFLFGKVADLGKKSESYGRDRDASNWFDGQISEGQLLPISSNVLVRYRGLVLYSQ